MYRNIILCLENGSQNDDDDDDDDDDDNTEGHPGNTSDDYDSDELDINCEDEYRMSKKESESNLKKTHPTKIENSGTSGKTYSRNKTEVSRKHPSDSQPLTAEEARQLQMEWMKRYGTLTTETF